MSDYLERSKQEWVKASTFPDSKESCYPEHTIVQQFDKHHNKSVYEYGIGGGSDLLSYLRRGNIVTGTDIVSENLEIAKQRILKAGFTEDKFNLVLLEDSTPLPFPDNQFDIASSHGVLHHILDPLPVVKEIHRILKKDGLFYVMLYTEVMEEYFKDLGYIEGFMKKYDVDYNEAFGYCTDNVGTPYSRSYSPDQAIDLVCPVGFVIEDYFYWLNDHFCTYIFKVEK